MRSQTWLCTVLSPLYFLRKFSLSVGCSHSSTWTQRRSQISEMAHGMVPRTRGSLPKLKSIFFRPRYFRSVHLRPWLRHLDPRVGSLLPKIGPYRSGIAHPEPLSSLFLLNVNKERLQYLTDRIENGPQDKRGGEMEPLSSPLFAELLKHFSQMTL